MADGSQGHQVNRAREILQATPRRFGGLPINLTKVSPPLSIDTPVPLDDVALQEPSTVLELRRLQDSWMEDRIDEDTLIKRIDELSYDQEE